MNWLEELSKESAVNKGSTFFFCPGRGDFLCYHLAYQPLDLR
jgi:hypothetical protein